MFTQLIRLGRDAELKYAPSGTAYCSIAGAYDVGHGDKKKTQWIDCVLFGKQAESLSQYLVKGSQCVVSLKDVEVEQWEKDGVNKCKLKAVVADLKFCGQKQEGQPKPTPKATPQPQSDSFDDMDIPF
jgi:single-strand DNA-binding protein